MISLCCWNLWFLLAILSATKNEKDTTRARANILREFLTNSNKPNRFDHKEIYEVMDLCLSCKGCKSECPSNVDVAKLKAEFLQHYYDANGVPFRSKLIANFTASAKLGALVPGLYNFAVTNTFTGNTIKKLSGFAVKRSMPKLYKTTLQQWFKKHKKEKPFTSGKKVFLFCDEFTNYNARLLVKKGSQHFSINLVQLPAGFYFLQLQGVNWKKSIRFIKQ